MPPTLFERLASRGICPPKTALTSSIVNGTLEDRGNVSRLGPPPLANTAVISTSSHAAASETQNIMQLEDAAVCDGSKLESSLQGDVLPRQREKRQKRRQPSSNAPAGEGTPRKTPRKRLRLSPHARTFATPQNRKPLAERHRKSSSRVGGSPQGLRFNSISETCAICCDNIGASEAVRFRCGHGWYCRCCVSRHIEARLDIGTVRQSCPECDAELFERDVKRLIPQPLMDRLLTRSLEQAVASTENLRPCPTPNCPMRVALEPDDPAQFTCAYCQKECCLRCGAQPYHKRMTCEKYAERMNKQNRRCSLMKWMKATGSKQCPSCQMAVTKETLEGQTTQQAECHKMLCRNCGTRFCFKCLAILTESFSCGCTKDEHGFVDPYTGKFVRHLKKKNAASKARDKENNPQQNSRRRAAAAAAA